MFCVGAVPKRSEAFKVQPEGRGTPPVVAVMVGAAPPPPPVAPPVPVPAEVLEAPLVPEAVEVPPPDPDPVDPPDPAPVEVLEVLEDAVCEHASREGAGTSDSSAS